MAASIILSGLLSAGPAGAQVAASPDPLDATVAKPPVYSSAFSGYRPYRSDGAQNWRSINERVKAVGGHAGSLRSDSPAVSPEERPAAAPREPVRATPAPAHTGHAGHGG